MNHSWKTLLFAVFILWLGGCESNENQIQADDNVLKVAIDVEAVTLDAEFTLNGGSFPASFYQRGAISLGDSEAVTMLGETWDGGSAEALIIKGNYESIYQHLDGALVPQNTRATVEDGLAIAADQALVVHVPRAIVVPTFSLDGGAFPTSVYDAAEFFLRPTGGTELISLGTTHVQPAPDTVVIPGTYDVIYSIKEGDQLPQNEFAVVMQSVDLSATPSALAVEIETCLFDGSWRLSVDGVLGEFPSSVYHRGEFSLRTDLGDSVHLGPSHASAGSVPVIAGTYNVVYNHLDGDEVPQNAHKVIKYRLVLSPGSVILEDVVDAWTTLSELSLDGGAFPGSVYENAEIFLVDEDTAALTSLGLTHSPLTSLLVIEGSYNTAYSHIAGSIVPQNKSAILGLNVVVDEADEVAAININSATVEGDFSQNSSDFIADVYHQADFLIHPSAGGGEIFLGNTYAAPEPVVVIAGSYDVVYRHVDGDLLPQNPHHVALTDQVFGGNHIVEVNILTREVRPAFTLNSQPFPASFYERGEFHLRGNHAGDFVYLGSSSDTPEDTLVIRGDYDAVYQHVQGSLVPLNSKAVVGQLTVD